MCPSRRIRPGQNGLGCASPLSEVGQFQGGNEVNSDVNFVMPGSKSNPVSNKWRSAANLSPSASASVKSLIAHSVEFVAKPQEAGCIQTTVPQALTGVLKDVAGFAGCLVMASNHEARLVTVVTLWRGQDAHKRCAQNVRWIEALLTPYVDRRLRIQTLVAALPVGLQTGLETNLDAAGCISEPLCPHEEEVCHA